MSDTGQLALHRHFGHLLRRAHQNDRANFAADTAHLKITPQQYAVLLGLSELGASSQRQLGTHVAMEPGNLHNLIRRIEKRQLILIGPSRQDRRSNEISLTRKGSQLLEKLRSLAEEASARTLAPLSAAEKEQLLSLLEKVAMPQ